MHTLAMLRRKHLAVLWVGLCLSQVGDYFYFVAVMWTAAKLAGSAAGLLAACQSATALATAPLTGVLADRLDRRHAMMGADLARATVLLALFAARGGVGLASLVLVALVLGGFDALFTAALLASVPALVGGPEELQATNGLIDITPRIARALPAASAATVCSSAHTESATCWVT